MPKIYCKANQITLQQWICKLHARITIRQKFCKITRFHFRFSRSTIKTTTFLKNSILSPNYAPFSPTLILTSRLPSRPCHEVIWRKSHKLNIFIEKILNKNLTSFGNSPKVDNYGRYCRHRIEVSVLVVISFLSKKCEGAIPTLFQWIDWIRQKSFHSQTKYRPFHRSACDGTRRREGRHKKRPWGGSWLRPPFAMIKKISFSAAIILICFRDR